MVSSFCYGIAIACAARGCAKASPTFLALGIFGIGFVGPALQLPTLGLGCLFSDGGTISMSVQAAAYDGGTFVFAFARELYDAYDVTAGTFLSFFLLVPLFTFTTGYLFWPIGSLEEDTGDTKTDDGSAPPDDDTSVSSAIRHMMTASSKVEQAGPGSPFLVKAQSSKLERVDSWDEDNTSLSAMLKSRPFLFLSAFAATHILKLNFVITSINAQTLKNFEPEQADMLTRSLSVSK